MNAIRLALLVALGLFAPSALAHAQSRSAPGDADPQPAILRANGPLAADAADATAGDLETSLRETIGRTLPTIALFSIASLVPAAVLMVTAFVRISIVLTLLRQALGSPQVPGNQVLAALALLLTALVMRPVAEAVHARAITPYADGSMGAAEAWREGSGPIKTFMADQIIKTGHQRYLFELYDQAVPPSPGQLAAEELEPSAIPLHVLAPAYLLSELTTALVMGFAIYLPFLVVDLVVAAVLAAMGLFMLPPTLVALPLKLILFVLADGWMLVSGMLLRSFDVA